MRIACQDMGKRYNREWIFRNFTYTFESDNAYVITGGNGSGKSTLLQALSGFLTISKGAITYAQGTDEIAIEKAFRLVSIATPYLDLYEELTLREALAFHLNFKALRAGLTIESFAETVMLAKDIDKQIKHYSSGMKQRVRLGLAILSDTPILLLDEPTSNLDPKGIAWYGELVTSHLKDRIVMVCSNQQEAEYFFCKHEINIEDFKRKPA